MVTINCHVCDWTTDIELTSDTNPDICPQCGGELFICGSDTPLYGEDGEYNPVLFDDQAS